MIVAVDSRRPKARQAYLASKRGIIQLRLRPPGAQAEIPLGIVGQRGLPRGGRGYKNQRNCGSEQTHVIVLG